MRKIVVCLSVLLATISVRAQVTFPVNGVTDNRGGAYAFTNVTLVQDANTTIKNATLVIENGKVAAINPKQLPASAIVIDCKDKFIYPSFIDLYSNYGIPDQERRAGGFQFGAPQQLDNNTKGAYGWNQAIKSYVDAFAIFSKDAAKAQQLRNAGFGTVLTHQPDGIVRGTGVVVTLSDESDNLAIVKEKASAHYSFSKGTSTQSYPSSMMGSIALLRQTYIDAAWYKNNQGGKEGTNLALQSFNNIQDLPQFFEANDKWDAIRADRVGDEAGVQYIIRAGGNEYQRIKDVAATKAKFIVGLNFPDAQDVEDPQNARFVSLGDLKAWELAPTNPAAFEKNNIDFCLTSSGLQSPNTFLANLRKAIQHGLTEKAALNALTINPAKLIGVSDKVGSLEVGKLANFIITSEPVFNDKSIILQNWVSGIKYGVKEDAWTPSTGVYNLVLNRPTGTSKYTLELKANNVANVIGSDTLAARLSVAFKSVSLSFSEKKAPRGGRGGAAPATAANLRLSGVDNGNGYWQGTGVDTLGNAFTWTATLTNSDVAKAADSIKQKTTNLISTVTYPFGAYGTTELPKQETILIKNTTVWTSESAGVLQATDVLLKNGKIAAIGKGLSDPAAKVIDGSGKHLSAGIIDEHSHIATSSINEGSHSMTSEARIGDNLNPDDVNIYRQLSGGVTTSHILHGSANTIGGQTQLIKLRWGATDEALKFAGADPFIKFALGENVKRTTSTNNIRFPDTRMGVEQVLMDAFQRASDYQDAIKAASAGAKKGTTSNPFTKVRRDLSLDALVEIMNSQRFITCHSYVQSEITYTMRVAEKFGFKVNTFTHILEGYKVADKMKTHGSNVSTFSDWWGYKSEVQDAISQNASIMHKVGLNVAINSDDAEMARRLNQEAAKSIKHDISKEEALKMVTINPAKMLHVDSKVGSIKVGKDADVVLWSHEPTSIYAKALTTIVDGTIYFDREKDNELRSALAKERNALILKMLAEKRGGANVTAARPTFNVINECGDHEHNHGILDAEEED